MKPPEGWRPVQPGHSSGVSFLQHQPEERKADISNSLLMMLSERHANTARPKEKFTWEWSSPSPSAASTQLIDTSSASPVPTYRSQRPNIIEQQLKLCYSTWTPVCDLNCELKVSVKQPEIVRVFFLIFSWLKLRVKSVREAAWERVSVRPRGHPAEFPNFLKTLISQSKSFNTSKNKRSRDSLFQRRSLSLRCCRRLPAFPWRNLASPPGSGVWFKNQVGPKLQLFFRSSEQSVVRRSNLPLFLLEAVDLERHLEPRAPPRWGQLSWRLRRAKEAAFDSRRKFRTQPTFFTWLCWFSHYGHYESQLQVLSRSTAAWQHA